MEHKQSKIGLVPKEWTLTKLKNIALKITDGTHDTPKKLEKGVPFITAIHVKDGSINFDESYFVSIEDHKKIYKRCNPEKGDLLLVNIGAGTATPALVRIEYEFSLKNVALIKPDPKIVDSTYLEAYQLYRKDNLFRRVTTGGAQPFLSLKDIGNLDIILPPLVEQQKIASILSTWDKAIKLKEELIKQKLVQKKELMNKLLSGEIRLNGFMNKWKKVTLGQLGETYNGLSGKRAEDFGQGKPYVTYKSIFDNTQIDLSLVELVSIKEGEKQNCVQYGDIFFTTSSETPDEVGMCSVLLDEVNELYLNSFCFGFRLNDFNHLLPEFARFLLRSNIIRKQMYKLAQGSTRFNISPKEVMKITLQLPAIEEQKLLNNILNSFEQDLILLRKQLDEMKAQKKGLMQNLLTGKVRVKV